MRSATSLQRAISSLPISDRDAAGLAFTAVIGVKPVLTDRVSRRDHLRGDSRLRYSNRHEPRSIKNVGKTSRKGDKPWQIIK